MLRYKATGKDWTGSKVRSADDRDSTIFITDDHDQRTENQVRKSRICKERCIAASFITLVVTLIVFLGIWLLHLEKYVVEDDLDGVELIPADPYDRALFLLTKYPLVDGHNDMPLQLRMLFNNNINEVDLMVNGSRSPPKEGSKYWQTDIPRLRAGRVGVQFWSAYMPCITQLKDATRTFIEQIDIIKLMVKKYPSTFLFATKTQDIERALQEGQIASFIGVEGGHAIDSSLAILRQLYDLGVRYMTLTHNCNTPWAHSAVSNETKGLTEFGEHVVLEMNRLGMLVDISHVNNYTMMDVLEISRAPVIFSHSSAFALCNHPRNVPDDILKVVKRKNGIIMATFVPYFINCNDPQMATLEDVADHIDHLKEVAGIDHVGIGSDYDGIDVVPKGLEDVSKYPALFAELLKRGYSESDVAKIARKNIIRVFKAVEKISEDMQEFPDMGMISPQPNSPCRTNKLDSVL